MPELGPGSGGLVLGAWTLTLGMVRVPRPCSWAVTCCRHMGSCRDVSSTFHCSGGGQGRPWNRAKYQPSPLILTDPEKDMDKDRKREKERGKRERDRERMKK